MNWHPFSFLRLVSSLFFAAIASSVRLFSCRFRSLRKLVANSFTSMRFACCWLTLKWCSPVVHWTLTMTRFISHAVSLYVWNGWFPTRNGRWLFEIVCFILAAASLIKTVFAGSFEENNGDLLLFIFFKLLDFSQISYKKIWIISLSNFFITYWSIFFKEATNYYEFLTNR